VLGTSDSVSAYTSRSKLPAPHHNAALQLLPQFCCTSHSCLTQTVLSVEFNCHRSAQRSWSKGRKVTDAVICRMIA
jgi:hypothetical protein